MDSNESSNVNKKTNNDSEAAIGSEATLTPESSTKSESTQNSNTKQANKPNVFQRFKSLFTKDNPHRNRNRCLMTLCPLAVIAAIVLVVVFVVVPSLNAEMVILGVEPTRINNDILDAKSHFIVNTEHGSIEDLRSAIYLEPAIDYRIEEIEPGSTYEIVPASDLADNTVFNVDSVSNGVVAYKWAYQTKKDLSISKIYPANGANYVSENTVIEFSFSYPDVEDVEDHFSITPEVPGTFEKNGQFWRFIPNSPLAADTAYEITISAGLTYGGETMLKDFHSTFSTFKREAVIASSEVANKGITLDGVSYFTEKDIPMVAFNYGDREYFDNSSYVAIEKITNVDDFIKHLNGEEVDTESIGNYDFSKTETSNGGRLAALKQTLPTGYYVFHFKSSANQDLYIANIEVNNIDAYAFESERDIIVWVAENGELKSGVKVNYQGRDYETGADGLLKIENASDYSDKIEYIRIGNSEQPLAIALKDFKNDLYPFGFIYTDRLLYAPNDTIRVWGYVPLQFFKDAPKRDGFSVAFDGLKQYIEVDSDGFFSCEIKLDNHKDISTDIALSYNDQQLARRWISVENYSLENYHYEFVSSKNFVNAGENIDFAVKVTHITGFPAINKDIVVTYKNNDYYATTNGEGEATFSLPTEYGTATLDNPSNMTSEYIVAKSGGAEYNKYSTSTIFYVFKNNMKFGSSKDDNSHSLKFTAKTIDLSKPVKTDYNFKNLALSNYSGAATVYLIESRTSRYISGYQYDEYRKENVPIYHTDSVQSVIGEISAEFVDGELTYNYPTSYKDPEENVYYSYYAVVSAIDSTGRPAYSYKIQYYSNYYLGESENTYYNDAIWAWRFYNPTKSEQYALYRFGLKDTIGESPYSMNDTIRLGLYDYSGASVKNAGKVLAIAYKESIITDKIFTDNTFDISFDHDMYPGAEVAGAYFKDGRFNRVAPRFFDYDEEDSKLNISIETDKIDYEPGETVKAKIIITHPDGSRASGRVNLSVVNEAIFNAMEDDTSILPSIYSNKQFKSYSVSTYRDYELWADGGLGSTGGGRADFGDTIFFSSKDFSNGEVEFEFKLNDSITSFRLTAIAVENGDTIDAGAGITKISSYLPLSISTVIPKRVKNTDDLVLNATSIISKGDTVNYTFTIEELGKTLSASAAPGQSVFVNFGKLELGTYTIIIAADDSAGNTDKMVYPVEIIETAQETSIKGNVTIEQNFEITPTKNPIIVEFYSGDTKHYINYLDFLESNQTERLDTFIAYYKAQEYRSKYYDEENNIRTPSFTSYLTTSGALKQLDSAEGDLVLTALVNYYMPNYIELNAANYGIDPSDDVTTAINKLLVQASFKETVLLDLKAARTLGSVLSQSDIIKLGIAFAFLGDYDSASELYNSINPDDSASADKSLFAILSSFIDKPATTSYIDSIINDSPASEYLSFAIISFFENNEVDLSDEKTITATVNSETDQILVRPLEIIKKIYYSENLAPLKFSAKESGVYADYYYQGMISDLGENIVKDITLSLDNAIVGQNATLTIDISNLPYRDGTLNIALPSALKFSATFSGEDGLYLVRNNNEYVKLSLSERYNGNIINVPLYVVTSGNYNFEPIIFEDNNGGYHISDNLEFDIR